MPRKFLVLLERQSNFETYCSMQREQKNRQGKRENRGEKFKIDFTSNVSENILLTLFLFLLQQQQKRRDENVVYRVIYAAWKIESFYFCGL